MSAWLVRRLAWLSVLCAVLYVGSLAGTVRSNDADSPKTQSATTSTGPDEAANPALQALGGLGVGHIQSTLGLIGVTADAFAKDVYTVKQVEDLMSGTINGIEAVKKLLRKLQDSELSADDEEFVDRMIGVFNALQREAKALMTFAKSRKPADGEAFEKARQSAVAKLGQLTEGHGDKSSDSADGRSE